MYDKISNFIERYLGNKKIMFFLFLPILFAYIASLYFKQNLVTHLYCVDPEYAYLLNALGFDNGKLPAHIDHPGTPLQLIMAMVIRVVYLFRSSESLNADVFANPELYLFYARITLIGLNTIVLFFLGYYVFKKTNNFWLGLFLQLTPIISNSVLSLQGRIVIEQMLVFSTMLLIITAFVYINSGVRKEGFIDKYVILFALILGFGTASKITFAPMFIIPVFLLSGYKKKLTFCFLSLAAFAAFAFPIFDHWVKFRRWVANLFLHSGQYGSGDANFIDVASFKQNLYYIYRTDFIFPFLFFVIALACIIFFIPLLRSKKRNFKLKFLIALGITILVIVVMVAKQYKYHYLSHAILLAIPAGYLILSLIAESFKIKNVNFLVIPAFLIILFAFFKYETRYFFSSINDYVNYEKVKIERSNFVVNKFGKDPVLVISNNYDTPFKEQAIYYGLLWIDGNLRANVLMPVLKNMYPNKYSYHPWFDRFLYWNPMWDQNYGYIELVKKHGKVVLMLGDPGLENIYSDKLHGLNRQLDAKYEKAYYNDLTHETYYYVYYDSVGASIKNYVCDAEKRDTSLKFFTNKYGQLFGNGETQSAEFAKSGKYSCKLTKDFPTGFTCAISEVDTTNNYTVSVWMFDNKNTNAKLIMSINGAEYSGQIIEKKGNWQKLQVSYKPDASTSGKNLKIYCTNNDTLLQAYFDDLEIVTK